MKTYLNDIEMPGEMPVHEIDERWPGALNVLLNYTATGALSIDLNQDLWLEKKIVFRQGLWRLPDGTPVPHWNQDARRVAEELRR